LYIHPQWLHSGLCRFKTARVQGRKTLDPNKLRSALGNHLDAPIVGQVLINAATTGADYERLGQYQFVALCCSATKPTARLIACAED